MTAKPGPASYPNSVVRMVDRCSATPDVGVMMQYPARCIIMFFGYYFSGFGAIGNHAVKWFLTFWEICHLNRPVVHFSINIYSPFAVPCWCQLIVPDSLQIGGLCSGAAARNQQISSILNIQCQKLRIICFFRKCHYPFIGRQFWPFIFGKLNIKTVE